ncbi:MULTISPECIES: DUF3455 domain-containing protein [Oxalobacteraceae]|uniref:DUF3455 domain-containing protein n=1 Tax=Herminiimonas sp. Marseille-P9896 TaxID=2742211 RepID=UPI00158D3C5A|nr:MULTISPECIES: DUF3455 domain-containing protein [Oxalobacteraceae]
MYAKITLLAAATALSACSGHMMKTPEAPAAVTVPAGNKVVMKTVGIGELTYQCRAKANMTGAFEWVLAGPDAILYDGNKMAVGKYYGGPTWEANDGSKVTGKQLAVSPNPGSIPLQLVQANPSMGKGAMSDITYIQRLNTVGGAAPATPCGAANVNAKQIVKYQADYVFYRASM